MVISQGLYMYNQIRKVASGIALQHELVCLHSMDFPSGQMEPKLDLDIHEQASEPIFAVFTRCKIHPFSLLQTCQLRLLLIVDSSQHKPFQDSP